MLQKLDKYLVSNKISMISKEGFSYMKSNMSYTEVVRIGYEM